MAQFTVYKSTDTSAPVLNSNADANNIIALLDAVLVNGYGSKAAAGWSHPFTGSGTKQVYRSGSGNRFYLRIVDDNTLTGGRRTTQVNGYISMTDVDTGVNQFPSAIQESASGTHCNWHKSVDVSATARSWTIYADDRTVYIFIQTGDTGATAGNYPLYAFGEFYSYVPNDLYNCLLIGVSTQAATASYTTAGTWSGDLVLGNTQGAVQSSHFKARLSTGTGMSSPFCKKGGNHLAATSMTASVTLLGVLAFLNTADSDLYLHPIWIMDGSSASSSVPEAIHGEMRGMYHQCHPISNYTDGDTASGAAATSFSAKTFVFLKQTPNAGVWTIETSNTLRTN